MTEYINGGALWGIIKSESLDSQYLWSQRVSFGKDTASGMAYLHLIIIIHRDLNSQSCLVHENRNMVVATLRCLNLGSMRRVCLKVCIAWRSQTTRSSTQWWTTPTGWHQRMMNDDRMCECRTWLSAWHYRLWPQCKGFPGLFLSKLSPTFLPHHCVLLWRGPLL
jgi:serine/threonine protein kinase